MISCVPYRLFTPASKLLSTMEIVEMIFDLCDLKTIVAVSRMSKYTAGKAQWYLRRRMCMLSKEFFDGSEYLTFTLVACNAVISGSTALHFLLPKSTTSWMPTDLDIYVPMRCQLQLGHLLKNKGYCLQKQVRANNPPLKIYSLMTFGNMEKKINVIVCTTDCVVPPILQEHCTAAMNFISASSIFCGCPLLTFCGLVMINSAQLYFGSFSHIGAAALNKYKEHGFDFITCPAAHNFPFACKSENHSLTDAGSLWVDIGMVPRAGTRPENVYQRLGIINMNWVLGGFLCRDHAALVMLDIQVTSNDS